jgi:tetratricopeptide (TPR) repeat protein
MRTLLLLLFIHINTIVSSQINHDQEMVNLLSSNKLFEADEYYYNHKDSIYDELVNKWYFAVSNLAFNKPDKAIEYYKYIINNYQNNIPKAILINNFYTPLKECYVLDQDYENAIIVCDSIIRILEIDQSLGDKNYLSQVVSGYAMAKRIYRDKSLYPTLLSWDNSDHVTTLPLIKNNLGLTIAKIYVGKNPINAIFDTGYTECSMNYSKAKELGVKIVSNDTVLLNGSVKTIMGILDSIQIQGIKIYNIPVAVNLEEKSGITKKIDEVNPADKLSSLQKVDTFFSSHDIIIGLPIMRLLSNIEYNFINNSISFYRVSKYHNKQRNLLLSQNKPYIRFKLNNSQYYTAFFDTGGSHGIIVNKDFYIRNGNLFSNKDSLQTRKRTMHGFANSNNHIYLEPNQLDITISNYTVSFKSNCMISEVDYNSLNQSDISPIYIGSDIFKNCATAVIDFNNMTVDLK